MRALPEPAALARAGVLLAAGAMPVLSIPLYIFDILSISKVALYLVLPLTTATVALAWHRSAESVWAVRGAVAGLAGVVTYDLLRMPMVFTGVWPDFIPRLGGWILGDQTGTNIAVGYAWRYIGDGGGMGLAFFVTCGIVGIWRYPLLASHPVVLGIGYGIFIWSGLVATVALSARGPVLLFSLTSTSLGLSLSGHLVYGSVLGLFLRRALTRHGSSPAR